MAGDAQEPKETQPGKPKVVGGAEELPGTPRPTKPGRESIPAAAPGDEHRKQRPGRVEEDAEVWVDPSKGGAGGWTTPSGQVVDGIGARNPDGTGGSAPRDPKAPLYADEDVEVTSSPRRPSTDPTPRSGPLLGGGRAATGSGGGGGYASGGPMPSRPLKPGESDTEVYTGRAPVAGLVSGDSPRPAPASDPDAIVYARDRAATGYAQGPPHRGERSKILLVGSGAREHAMALALVRSGAEVYAVPRHRNPGIVKVATGFRLLDERDVPGIVAWARAQKVGVAVVGPESALEAGLTDALRAAGIPTASPSKAAARIETDKTFMRDLMARHDLPGRLAHHPFTNQSAALAFLDKNGPKWAIKPIGLTGGKGVQVYGDHFTDLAGAKSYVASIFEGKVGGGALQFEELAHGEEFTVMAFCDGTTILPMPAIQDHKRLLEGDQGPNTGGMGSYSQADGLLPFLSRGDYDESLRVLHGIVDALRKDGTPYVGTIYGQFMLTATGPKVIEVNARFGDPEAVNACHLLASNYADILHAMAAGKLAGMKADFRPRATVVKYVVPNGYGEGKPTAGRTVQVDEFNLKRAGGTAYYAHVEQHPGGPLSTMSSRAIAVLGEGDTIALANDVCEAALRHVHGEGLHVRHDIGSSALIAKRMQNMAALRAANAQRAATAAPAPAPTPLVRTPLIPTTPPQPATTVPNVMPTQPKVAPPPVATRPLNPPASTALTGQALTPTPPSAVPSPSMPTVKPAVVATAPVVQTPRTPPAPASPPTPLRPSTPPTPPTLVTPPTPPTPTISATPPPSAAERAPAEPPKVPANPWAERVKPKVP